MEKRLLSRRDMLSLMASVSAGCMLSPEEVLAASADKTVLIPHATHFGPLNAEVKNGKFVRVQKSDLINYVPDTLYSLNELVYSPNRIKTPCVRKSFLEGRRENELRGAEEFVSVSWETALDLVAEELLKVKEEYGNEAIYRTSFQGWSNPGCIGKPNIMQGRFLGLFGGFTDTVSDYSAGATSQTFPYVTGDLEPYTRYTSLELLLEYTETIVLWGCDPLKILLSSYGVPVFEQIELFYEMKKRGKRFISIDPVYNETAKKFDAEWISINPTTDTAVILSMCNYLYKTGNYDKKFIERCTVGFDKFMDYVLGKTDGKDKNTAWAEKKSGMAAAQIEKLANTLRQKNTFIYTQYSAQRCEHGEQFHWSLMALCCMLGQIGTPGGGVNMGSYFYSYPVVSPRIISQGKNPAKTYIPASRICEALLNPGKTIDHRGNKLTYPMIKLIYNMGANPLSTQPDTNSLLKGMRNVDTIITHEIVWTPFAKLSDIVLPAVTTFERNDISVSCVKNKSYIWAMKQVVEPQHQAKKDFWILQQLAKRLGFEEKFTLGRSEMDWLRWSYEGVGSDIPFDEFWEKGHLIIRSEQNSNKFIRLGDFVKDPLNNPLLTPSGKIEIYSEKIANFGYDDCAGHPKWYEPKEALCSPLAKKFQFHLLSSHPKYRLHSQLDNLNLNKVYKKNGREPALINEQDARELGIKDGDNVEIFNDRGTIVCSAILTSKIKRKVLVVNEGAWYSLEHPGKVGSRCLSGNANVLTTGRPSSKLTQACAAMSCLVALRKTEKNTKQNTAYINPEVIISKI